MKDHRVKQEEEMAQASRSWRLAAALLVLMSAGLASCGPQEGSGDSVWLHFFNGYVGSDSMTVIGPTGTLVSGVPFGQRTEAVLFDRTLGTDLTVLLDVVPEPVDLNADLYSLYPQEEATLLVKRRDGENSLASIVYRHVMRAGPQFGGHGCVMELGNALSVNSEFSGVDLYDAVPMWRAVEYRVNDGAEEVAAAGLFFPTPSDPVGLASGAYVNEDQGFIPTECGPLRHNNRFPRGNPYNSIVGADKNSLNDNLYLFPVQADEGFTLVWGFMEAGQSGLSVMGVPGTQAYLDCLGGALSVKQPDMGMNPLPTVPPNAGANCPSGGLSFSDFDIDLETVHACRTMVTDETPLSLPAGGDGDYQAFLTPPTMLNPEETNCKYDMQFASGIGEIFNSDATGAEQPHNRPGNALPKLTPNFSPGGYYTAFLYGRPVNPFIFEWTTEQNPGAEAGTYPPGFVGDPYDSSSLGAPGEVHNRQPNFAVVGN